MDGTGDRIYVKLLLFRNSGCHWNKIGPYYLVVQEAEVFFCDTERRDGLGLKCLVLEDEGGPVDIYERAWEWV